MDDRYNVYGFAKAQAITFTSSDAGYYSIELLNYTGQYQVYDLTTSEIVDGSFKTDSITTKTFFILFNSEPRNEITCAFNYLGNY